MGLNESLRITQMERGSAIQAEVATKVTHTDEDTALPVLTRSVHMRTRLTVVFYGTIKTVRVFMLDEEGSFVAPVASDKSSTGIDLFQMKCQTLAILLLIRGG